MDLSLSPVLDDSQGDVKCDVATAECTQTSVYGATFVNSAQLACRLTLFKVRIRQGSEFLYLDKILIT